MCSTRPASRCRSGSPASCTSAARASPAAIWTGRADRRAVRARPVRPPGARLYRTGDRVRLMRRRRARVPRPARRPGQDARPPDRARRDRGRLLAATRHHATLVGRRAVREPGGTVQPDRLHRAPRKPQADAPRRLGPAETAWRRRCPSRWSRRISSCSTSLPLTPNGKLDRSALPEAEVTTAHASPPPPPRPNEPSPRSGPKRLGLAQISTTETFSNSEVTPSRNPSGRGDPEALRATKCRSNSSSRREPSWRLPPSSRARRRRPCAEDDLAAMLDTLDKLEHVDD